MPDYLRELKNDHDGPDAAHKAGDHGVGNVMDVVADAQDPQHNLDNARQSDHREDPSDVARQGTHDAGDDHGHRSGGARDLGRSAAEQSGKETDRDRAVEPSSSAIFQAGSNTKAECQRQRHNAGGHTAEQITL